MNQELFEILDLLGPQGISGHLGALEDVEDRVSAFQRIQSNLQVTNEFMGRHKISLVIVINQLQGTGITKNVDDQDDV